jgi:hypothetical protein
MKVLIACEYSGTVREAFKKAGHDAWSCDILPTEIPGQHIQGDVLPLLSGSWDMLIAHPPCTFLSVSGARWFYHPDDGHLPTSERRAHPKYPNRKKDQEDAVAFFLRLYNCKIPKIAIENPLGVMSTKLRKPDQIIEPFMFGDEASKKTCLWLKGLPKLVPTNVVGKGKMQVLASGKVLPEWYSNASKKDRGKIRSKTFQGIADAMAEQWS